MSRFHDDGEFLRQMLFERLRALSVLIDDAYRNRQLQLTRELTEQAKELARAIELPEVENRFRVHLGMVLFQLDELQAAITELSPLMQPGSESTGDSDLYLAFTTFLQAAQNIPVDLARIEKAYDFVERFLLSRGHTDWRDETLVMRVRLESYRGRFREALAVAQDAWHLKANSTYLGQVVDFHLDALTTLSLQLGDTNGAIRYLDVWERQEVQLPLNRLARMTRCLADLSRHEGRWDDAVQLARQAAFHAEQSDYHETTHATRHSLIRALIGAGELAAARDELARYALLRRSESLHDVFRINLLMGDYHLAAARDALGVPPTDDQYGGRNPAPPTSRAKSVGRSGATHSLARALRRYRSSGRIGDRIDGLLRCSHHRDQVNDRIDRCEQVAGERRIGKG